MGIRYNLAAQVFGHLRSSGFMAVTVMGHAGNRACAPFGQIEALDHDQLDARLGCGADALLQWWCSAS